MPTSYFFYDLETSGLSARNDRIMQFAGQRTDLDLNPIGEPYNILVALNDDTLPSPDALAITRITPQKTVEEGYSEAEFAKLLHTEIFTEGTVAVGFNNIRFDDEFIRHLFWRNFYDPYAWTWQDDRSRWDLLDVVRITRALRPEGISWPVDAEGKATNRLELLSKQNGIEHLSAHDALSDVEALIGVTKLIQQKQPQLFSYLFTMRSKKKVAELVNLDDKRPFVYTSGRYDQEYQKTTVAFPLAPSKNSNVIVYDLRYDPTPFLGLSAKELSAKIFASWEDRKKDDFVRVPVKEMQYNRAPAVAPLGVLEQSDGWNNIGLNLETVEKHKAIIAANPQFAENIRSAFEGREEYKKSKDPEAMLYDGFVSDKDRMRVEVVRNADERQLADFHPEFSDERLAPLLLHYKARSFPRTLSETEVAEWEKWRSERLASQLPGFMKSLSSYATNDDDSIQFIMQELQLWAESILPVEDY